MDQKRVMIVEDEGLIARDLADRLNRNGYEVAGIFPSGEEALSGLENALPDIVLMDIRLQGKMSGIDAASRVRANHKVPVIFLTSHADPETVSMAREAEAYGYLLKPFRPADLTSAIEMALYKHRSERLLMDREAWLSTVINSSADAIFVTGVEGYIRFMNPSGENLLGLDLSGVVGRPWRQVLALFDEGSQEATEDFARMAAMQQERVSLPSGFVLRRPHGEQIHVEGEFAPSHANNRSAGVVITLRDVSRRVQLEAEVRHEQKVMAVGRLAGGVAHDFNNLLTVIISQGTELIESLSQPEDIRRMENLLNAADASADIAQQLLTLSRRQVLETQLLDVNDCVTRTAHLVEPSLGSLCKLNLDLAKGVGKVRMNPGQFTQIVLNLLLNSRDAMPMGGPILVSTSNVDVPSECTPAKKSKRYVRLVVTDSGEGIKPEIQEQIFDPFFTTKPEGIGNGLGLALVYGIVKDTGGKITVRSTPGLGASFDVLLPRGDEDSRPAPRPSRQAEAQPDDPKTILLVEDQAAIRGLIHNFLEQKGFQLIEAEHGAEALALAEMYEGKIDVLISDVLMPHMDGPTLATRLNEGRPGMRTLFLTGHPGNSIDAVRKASAKAEFLQKPFTLFTLLGKIEALTAQGS